MRRLFLTNAPGATVLIRLLVGSVFLSEGIQKFLYPADLAAGRFAKIGIPAPQIMGPFVGVCEILCGALLVIGLLTRLAAIVLLIDISVAIGSTKIPVLLGHGFWTFALMKLPRYGFWSMMHGAPPILPCGSACCFSSSWAPEENCHLMRHLLPQVPRDHSVTAGWLILSRNHQAA